MTRNDPNGARAGASPVAIRAHYDAGNAFYRLWLDETLTYSCAMYETDEDTLEAAQTRKLDHHIAAARATGTNRVLDVGCGWGSMLHRLLDGHGVGHAVGLTLSHEQARWIEDRKLANAEVRLEHWADHEAGAPYDAIVSVGAMEHFVRPEQPSDERTKVYREFFTRCRDLLVPGGYLSLQTSVYSFGGFVTGAIAEIFPESDLPRLSQIAAAAEGVLEVVAVRTDRMDYARTCAEWRQRLRDNKEAAIAASDGETYGRYARFLSSAVKGFEANIFNLLRITLRSPEF